MRKDTYWNSKGKHQALADKLNDLIPASDEVPNKKQNKALEKFRKASNCYYDLYNNGLGNRATQFYHVFNLASTQYKSYARFVTYTDELYDLVEDKTDAIILAAAKEQNIS